MRRRAFTFVSNDSPTSWGLEVADPNGAPGFGTSRRRALGTKKGCFLKAHAGSEAFDKVSLPMPETERIYRRIASERSTGLIGDQISVADLVRRFETGRNVIQKVLARMQEDGLVEKTAGHGWGHVICFRWSSESRC